MPYIEPSPKRQKLGSHPSSTPRPSRIFAPYRTVGLVSPTNVPFTSVALGKTTFQITTCTGRSLHTYDLRSGLNLVFITRPETPSLITATVAWKDQILVAWGGGGAEQKNGIWIFKRGKKVGELATPAGPRERVSKLIVFGSWIVACCTTRVEVWKSISREYHTTIFPPPSVFSPQDAPLTGAMCTMPTVLNKVFLGKHDGSVELWNLNTGKLVHTFLPFEPGLGTVTALEPSPALDLLAIARSNGSLTIQDIRNDREMLRLNTTPFVSKIITSISFRTDGLGAGLDGTLDGVMATAGVEDGDVTFWDLNDGGRVMSVLRNAHYPAPTTNDGSANGITGIEFLAGQPVIVTSGYDNSLRTWVFYGSMQPTLPSPLHSRSGHAAPITQLVFLPTQSDGADATGKWLLSAGHDRSLWGWSLRRDGQSTELSQGNVQKRARSLSTVMGSSLDAETRTQIEDLRAPEISCIATCLNRDGGMGTSTGGGQVWQNLPKSKSNTDSDTPPSGWESVVTGHKGDRYARTWFWGRKKAGRWAFETGDKREVKSVAITSCGTFALIGSAGGLIEMFNLQSGKSRQKFPQPLTKAQAKKRELRMNGDHHPSENGTTPGDGQKFSAGEGRHTREVTGIMVDNLNKTVFSCGLDGKVKFWDFATGELRHELDWYPMTAISTSRMHQQNDLIALSCDDLSIRVIDCETRKLVRELWGCVGQVTDFCFSDDGRWIVAASMDSVIRVWDLPTGHLVDAMRVPAVCTSLAFSPTGEFLATAHADSIGVNIWTNRSLFMHVQKRQMDDEATELATLPTASGEGADGLLAAAFEDVQSDEGQQEGESLSSALGQLSADMTTLSLVPRSRWQTLLHLETISARNKPIEPPKAPEKVPFFLPSLEKIQTGQTVKQIGGDAPVKESERSRILALQRHGMESVFTQLLHQAPHDLEAFVLHFKSLSPSKADIEIRSLDPTASPNELVLFIKALAQRAMQRQDYEVVQAWMSVFLKIHGEIISQYMEAMEALKEWKRVQEMESRRLGSVVGYCTGVVSFLRSTR